MIYLVFDVNELETSNSNVIKISFTKNSILFCDFIATLKITENFGLFFHKIVLQKMELKPKYKI